MYKKEVSFKEMSNSFLQDKAIEKLLLVCTGFFSSNYQRIE